MAIKITGRTAQATSPVTSTTDRKGLHDYDKKTTVSEFKSQKPPIRNGGKSTQRNPYRYGMKSKSSRLDRRPILNTKPPSLTRLKNRYESLRDLTVRRARGWTRHGNEAIKFILEVKRKIAMLDGESAIARDASDPRHMEDVFDAARILWNRTPFIERKLGHTKQNEAWQDPERVHLYQYHDLLKQKGRVLIDHLDSDQGSKKLRYLGVKKDDMKRVFGLRAHLLLPDDRTNTFSMSLRYLLSDRYRERVDKMAFDLALAEETLVEYLNGLLPYNTRFAQRMSVFLYLGRETLMEYYKNSIGETQIQEVESVSAGRANIQLDRSTLSFIGEFHHSPESFYLDPQLNPANCVFGTHVLNPFNSALMMAH